MSIDRKKDTPKYLPRGFHFLFFKTISGMQNESASFLGFTETFVALFVLNYWLREFPLSAIANRFEFLCQKIN